jgi:hypothetical protein
MQFRRVSEADYVGMLALQEANLFENVAPAARPQGFLSARFSREHFARMDADVGVMVAVDAGRVAGYACASGIELNREFPLLAAMLGHYALVSFRGRTLADQNSFVYGPVCVDSAYRGRVVVRGLYQSVRAMAADRFEVGVGFVAEDNPHSLAAHVTGLGMHDVGGFEFKSRRYRVVAFTTGG